MKSIAQAIADALPPTVEEVVLTGSVSRGVADDVSDIEMLIVTPQPIALEDCFAHARAAGLERLGHALQELFPARYSDSRTDDQGSFARTDLLDERLGDRVLVHPKPLCLL